MESLLEVLVPHKDRLRWSLTQKLTDRVQSGLITTWFSSPAPHLEKLELISYSIAGDRAIPQLLDDHTPPLRELSFSWILHWPAN